MTAIAARAYARWNALFDEPGSVRGPSIMRLLIGPMVLLHLTPFLAAMRQGRYYADSFYSPWVSWLPEAPRGVYFALLSLCVVSAVTLSLGLFTRASALYTCAFVGYNLFLSETHFRHNRAFLLINLAFLALIPCGRLLSLDAWLARRAGRPPAAEASLWPLYLMRFEAVSIYSASGFSKLINPDWWSGLVTYDRVQRFQHRLEASIAPDWLIALVTDRGFHHAFGKIAILTELFVATGLLLPATRRAAIWVAIVFHVAIGIGLHVEVFSYLAIAATLIWVTPRTRDRVLFVDESLRGGRLLAFCARRLDWLARFDLRAADGGGALVRLVDRDGRELTGAPAARLALSRCPLLFFWVAPFHLPGLRALWDRGLRGAFG